MAAAAHSVFVLLVDEAFVLHVLPFVIDIKVDIKLVVLVVESLLSTVASASCVNAALAAIWRDRLKRRADCFGVFDFLLFIVNLDLAAPIPYALDFAVDVLAAKRRAFGVGWL